MQFRRLRRLFGVVEKNLGAEWDDGLVTRLGDAVRSLGGSMDEKSWGVAGSQEITRYAIRLPGARLSAIGETYMGLTIRGPRREVERLATMMVTGVEGDV